jgi:hypothetical protein
VTASMCGLPFTFFFPSIRLEIDMTPLIPNQKL